MTAPSTPSAQLQHEFEVNLCGSARCKRCGLLHAIPMWPEYCIDHPKAQNGTETVQTMSEKWFRPDGSWLLFNVDTNLFVKYWPMTAEQLLDKEAELTRIRSALTTIHNGGCPTLERCMVVAGKALFPL